MRIAPLTSVIVTLAAPVASAQTLDRSESSALVTWINQARAERHLAPLTSDPRLDALAEAHSADMATWGYFSHQSPTTGTVEDRAATAGVRWRALGENIAFNESTRAAHEALLRSPGHYANITGAYRSVGVGIVRSGDGVYVTEVFGTLVDPLPAQAEPSTQPPQARQPSQPTRPSQPARPAAPRAPAPDDAAPPADDAWSGWGAPPFMQGWGFPFPTAPRANGPRGRSDGAATRHSVRNCEVDTPFGHVSISIAGDGIDTSGLPCNPDARGPSSQPQAHPPAAAPRGRQPSRRAVPRIEVPPVPSEPLPAPSAEPLGSPVTI